MWHIYLTGGTTIQALPQDLIWGGKHHLKVGNVCIIIEAIEDTLFDLKEPLKCEHQA